MSFQEKISAMLARPGQDPVAKEDVPWWMKFAGRGIGTVGGLIAILVGVWNCTGLITVNISSFISGVWLIVAGFIMLCCEAPCCCMFIDHVQRLSDWIDGRPYWNRALGYVVLAIPPIIIYTGVSCIFGAGLIFTTGVIYGMMALGRKATAEEMRQAATTQNATAKPTANLVANAQPISFTGAPVFDSNV